MYRIAPAIAAVALVATACGSASSTSSSPATTAAEGGASAPSTTLTKPTVASTTLPPTTLAPTTTAAEAEASDEDIAAITLAYEIVFSSETSYEEKAPLIVDPTGLEETVTKYQTTGEQMGGVGLLAKQISVSDDLADVTYDLLFGGNPTYPDLTGDAVRIDGTWKITREMFCSIMTSARVGCPAS